MRTTITEVLARVIFDGRGRDTIEVEIRTEGGGRGRFAAPSGTSKGAYEVIDYPPGGAVEAVEKVRKVISPRLAGVDAADQRQVDEAIAEIDGSERFSSIGGNTAYALSMAAAEAAANTLDIPLCWHLAGEEVRELPYPLGNVISGGKHAGQLAPDIQEFLVLPIGARSISEALRMNMLATSAACEELKSVDPSFSKGCSLEGAWIANVDTERALEILAQVCDSIKEDTGVGLKLGADFAASTIWNPRTRRYEYRREKRSLTAEEQINFVMELAEKFPILYFEDPLHEDDFEGFAILTKELKGRLICGDDLFVTNSQRLKRGIEVGAGNAAIVKPNQVGTITRAKEAADLAKAHGYTLIASHRSGESTDYHLTHLAVAFGCPIIKTGILGGERIAKLNELLRLEELGFKLAAFKV